MSELQDMLRVQARLHRKQGANALGCLFENAGKEIGSLSDKLAKANERVKSLSSLLREISIEYECDIRHKYSGMIDVPNERSVTRKAFDRDMEVIGIVKEQLRKEQD